MKPLTAILILITLTLSCCRRDDEKPMQHHTLLLPQEVKDYLLFKSGTYWVYQNSKTMELDSLYVYKSSNYIDTVINIDVNREFIYETLDVKMYGSYEPYSLHLYSVPPIPENPSVYQPKINKIKIESGNVAGETPVFFHPFKIETKFYVNAKGDGYLILKETLNNIDINGSRYNDVVIFSNTYDVTSENQKVNYYYSKNIGLIKKEYPETDESWNLIRYHIVK